jgi:hypothetical protein
VRRRREEYRGAGVSEGAKERAGGGKQEAETAGAGNWLTRMFLILHRRQHANAEGGVEGSVKREATMGRLTKNLCTDQLRYVR